MVKKTNILKIFILFISICSIILIIFLINLNKGANVNKFLSEFLNEKEHLDDNIYKNYKKYDFLVILTGNNYNRECYNCVDNKKVIKEFIEMIKKGEPKKLNKREKNIKFSDIHVTVYLSIHENMYNEQIMFTFDNSEQFRLTTLNDEFNNVYKLKYKLDENFYKYFIEKYNMKKEK
ncbi:hypothetical protein JYG23_02775 [Sedimentibacter sp. zth1]|uniref:hypothetical protein n=1 Tax=Sedimentibacter sp. zth1 TaxID=2816908 RepID=UPI001A9149A5|nr:hypothetical protein [Sedimentibacter sp. zth1]QSX06403.1 hypothetical protein JYG23_02775 [Sedimentibacter sp. zth1]